MSETNGVEMSNRKDVDAKKLAREEKLRDAKIEDQVRRRLTRIILSIFG